MLPFCYKYPMIYSIQQQLQKSITLHNSGQTGEAIKLCEEILKTSPNEPNILQLLGAFKNSVGEEKEAESFFRKSLKINSKQPHVYNNLANLISKKPKKIEALKLYKKATELNAAYADAWYNWSVLLYELKDIEEALKKITTAISYDIKQAKYHNHLGICHRGKKNFPAALSAFEKAVSLSNNHPPYIHNLGTVYREIERYPEAVNCFNYVLNNQRDIPETWEALGSLYHATEDFDRSIIAYNNLLELNPEDLKIHRVLNNMMWETGRHQGFLSSYTKAMEAKPESLSLISSYAEELALSGGLEQAVIFIKNAIKEKGPVPELLHQTALLENQKGNFDQARHLMEKLVKAEKNNAEYYTDFAEILLNLGDYSFALEQAERAEHIEPNYQKIWSIKGDCWRSLGDERYYWLNDFDNFIQPMEIKVPEGYKNIEDFNHELETALKKLHISDINPRDQTLRGGTQTIGDLYQNHAKIIQQLRLSVLDAAARYIKALPDDESHPHLRRKTEMLKFVGAWSVLLSSEGFHVNHYHSKGWISGPYYVKIPKIIENSTLASEKAGWVNFGASPYGSKKFQIPERTIKPTAGFQVFFPSYMWHGTNPFVSDEIRMTAPCDIVPL